MVGCSRETIHQQENGISSVEDAKEEKAPENDSLITIKL